METSRFLFTSWRIVSGPGGAAWLNSFSSRFIVPLPAPGGGGGEGACLPEAHSQGTWKHNKNTSIPSVKA